MHGNYSRDTEGKGPGAARSHRQGAHVEVWHLNELRQSSQAPRLVYEKLHEETGHHRQGELQTGNLLLHRKAGLLQKLPVEPSRTVNQRGPNTGSGNPDVSAVGKDQRRCYRKIQ